MSIAIDSATHDELRQQLIQAETDAEGMTAEMYRLRAENEQLRDDLNLRHQTAMDRKEIIRRLEAENGRMRAALGIAREQIDRNAHGKTTALRTVDAALEQEVSK